MCPTCWLTSWVTRLGCGGLVAADGPWKRPLREAEGGTMLVAWYLLTHRMALRY